MEFERKIIEHDMIAFQELYNNNISELVAFAYRFTYDIEIAKDWYMTLLYGSGTTLRR